MLQVHGEIDEVVPFARGRQTNEILKDFVKDIEFITYPHMGHEGTQEELNLVKNRIEKWTP